MNRLRALLSASALLVAASPASASRWVPMDVPDWSALGLVDMDGRAVEGSVVTAWLRFVDAPGRPPAEDDPEIVDAMRDGGHVDLRASVDCAGRRFRVEGTRIVDARDAVLDQGMLPTQRTAWVPLGERTRASASFAALCRADGRPR